jgi:O-antigen ligase
MNNGKLEFAPRALPQPLPAGLEIAAAGAAAVILAILMLFSSRAAVAMAFIAGALVLLASARGVYRHPEFLLAALLFVEVLPSATLLPLTDAQRPLIRYPLYLLFALPAVPAFLRSHLLDRGGFRLYALYFAWALATALYSLAPVFSAGRALAASVLFFAIGAVAARAGDRSDIERELRVFFAGGALLVWLLAITAVAPGLEAMAWSVDEELGRLRFSGYFESPNQAGELAMVTIGAALYCWSSWRRPVMRIASAVTIALSVTVLVIADSRSAAVAMTLGAGAWTIWRYRGRGVFGVAVIAMGLLVALSALGPEAMRYITRHDISSLTGRTVVWRYSLNQLARRPLLGYGYAVEGAIFNSKYFPLWDDLWTQGPRIPIHNAYLSRAIGLGVPALLLWFFLFFRPFIHLLTRRDDPMNLKPLALLIVLPVLVLNISETLGGDCRYPAGLITALVWAVAEIQRLRDCERETAFAESFFKACR